MKEKIKKLLMQVDKELIIDNLIDSGFFSEIETDEDIVTDYFLNKLLNLDSQKKEQKKEDLLQKKWDKAREKKNKCF